MAFNELILEYALEGNSNFIAWKDHMEVMLDDNRLLEYVKTHSGKPRWDDADNLDQWKKDVAKARRIILEGVWDHIFSSLHGKATPYAMWKDLTDLF